jgi:hypothetical protein
MLVLGIMTMNVAFGYVQLRVCMYSDGAWKLPSATNDVIRRAKWHSGPHTHAAAF